MNSRGVLSLVNLLHGFVPGTWTVVLSNILRAHGHGELVPWSFAVFGLAATMGPLVTGALADRCFSSEKLLGILWCMSSLCLAGCGISLISGAPSWVFLIFLLLQALSYGPTWSLLAISSFANLKHPSRDYPKIRVFATIGWVLSGWTISGLMSSETTPTIFFLSSAMALVLAALSPLLPPTPPKGEPAKHWSDWIGWPAISLLKEKKFRNYLISAFLFTIPLTAYYAYTPVQLADLNCPHVAATMGCGQIVEIIGMLILGWLLVKFSSSALLFAAMILAICRTLLCSLGWIEQSWQLTAIGAALHGLVYTFYFINAQIFVQQSVPDSLRAQAQALLVFFTNGLGSLIGYSITGFLFQSLTQNSQTLWTQYWLWLTALLLLPLAWLTFSTISQKSICAKN